MLVLYACDFEYDGKYLSDYGFVICSFSGTSDYTISAGSKITFNKVQRHSGKIYSLSGTQYDECITSEFDICKDPSENDDLQITSEEYRDIMRWLNRREFLKFNILSDDPINQTPRYYNASFNVEKIMVNDILYGLALKMETDKPFGFGQDVRILWNISDVSRTYVLSDTSDEIGHTYPSMTITCASAGDLKVHNDTEKCTMIIKNVSVGEVINIDGSTHVITSSLNSHKIYDDFNFEYFRIGNSISNRSNKISVSLPCKLELRYSPIIKDTPD